MSIFFYFASLYLEKLYYSIYVSYFFLSNISKIITEIFTFEQGKMNYQKYLRTHCSYLITFPLYIRRYQTAQFNKILSIPLEQRQSPQSKCRRFRRINRNATAGSRHSSCRLVSSALKNRSISIVCRNIVHLTCNFVPKREKNWLNWNSINLERMMIFFIIDNLIISNIRTSLYFLPSLILFQLLPIIVLYSYNFFFFMNIKLKKEVSG